MKAQVIPLGNYGKISLPQITGINHWAVIVALLLLTTLLFWLFEKHKL
jgi:hypothetical protein